MIIVKPFDQCDWRWTGIDVQDGHCPQPEVWHEPAERVSAVLGPDGEPLRVGYERRRIGFDLTPRAHRAQIGGQ